MLHVLLVSGRCCGSGVWHLAIWEVMGGEEWGTVDKKLMFCLNWQTMFSHLSEIGDASD